ncbi:MAG: hypothetical protein WC480_00200 [Patescibacteria group bacterium]
MFNWRRPIIYFLFYLSGSKIPANLRLLHGFEKMSGAKQQQYQQDKLKEILLHAYNHVPYYHKILSESGVVDNGQVNLDNFNQIPLLTKDIIRQEGANLYSDDYQKRKFYQNTSGGSTGEPVKFLQDHYYDESNIATKIHFNEILGKSLGDKEIKLWGSDRDIIKGNLALRDRCINWLYNRRFLNSYNFSSDKMKELVELNNNFKPVSYWTYVDSTYEFSKFVSANNIKLYSPKYIVTSIGPLYPEIKSSIELAFNCPVYNQYGSRELGAVAFQDKIDSDLQVFFWRHLVEISDLRDGMGRVVVTCLDNFSMPLIRYEVGDVAQPGVYYNFSRTKSYLNLHNVVGRTLGYFKTQSGGLKHTHFIIQQLFFRDWIKKFQLIQKEYNLVELKIVGEANSSQMRGIEEKIKLFMGADCRTKWNFVDQIDPTPSGKYLYTVCEIK